MQYFDAACLIGRWPSERLAFQDTAGLLGEMDRLGIQRALVSHTLAWQNSPADGNRMLIEALQGNPRLLPCWVVTPGAALEASGGVEGLCTQMAAHGVRAVRLYPREHVFPLAGWFAGDLLQALDERRYVVILDLDQVFLQVGMYDYDANGLARLEWLCRTYPNLSVILSRIGYRAYQDLLVLMAACPNLYLDTSYFATHQGLEEMVQRFGAGRVVFATAQPLADAGGALARLQLAGLEPAEQDLIAHANLERLLGRVQLAGPLPAAPPEATPPEINTLVELARRGQSLAPAGIEITDAHGHLGPYHKFHIPHNDAAGLVAVMDRVGVTQLAISSHMAVSADWQEGNRLTARAVAQFPDRLIGQAVVSPNEPELARPELEHCFDGLGFRAIKLVPDTHAHPIGGPGYTPAWEFAAERGCLLLCHTFHGSRFDDPQLFAPLAERYPRVPILVVHSGALTAAFEGAIALAKAHPNIYLDVSGSYITGAWIRRLVRSVGPERVIFSSDMPFIDLRCGLGRVLYAGLDPAELVLVLGGNIRRLLRLPSA